MGNWKIKEGLTWLSLLALFILSMVYLPWP